MSDSFEFQGISHRLFSTKQEFFNSHAISQQLRLTRLGIETRHRNHFLQTRPREHYYEISCL